jgi:hypothetical protein
MRGNSPVRFGKRPTEKDPNHGHLAGGLFHSTGGSWKQGTLATDTEKNSSAGNRPSTMAPRPTARNCHRASSRPYTGVAGWLAVPRNVDLRLVC